MVISKKWSLIIILILIVGGVLIRQQTMKDYAYSNQEDEVAIVKIEFNMSDKDPTMNFLGKSFDELKQVLGEPDEQGYSDFLGPHDYILFQQDEGFVMFCSPESTENNIVVSIILGPGQGINGARVGMPFIEIEDILGLPDFGPELGLDDLYYMGYFYGETKYQIPEVFVSFSAVSIEAPTQDVFIKWEAFEDDQIE